MQIKSYHKGHSIFLGGRVNSKSRYYTVFTSNGEKRFTFKNHDKADAEKALRAAELYIDLLIIGKV